jgi:hypothetical protein
VRTFEAYLRRDGRSGSRLKDRVVKVQTTLVASPRNQPKLLKYLIDTGRVRLCKRFPPRKAALGPYNVVAQLPERDGQLQYRIKSGCEPFYRTVTENELESDVGATVTSRRIPV